MRADPAALARSLAVLSRSVQDVIAQRRIYCLTPIPNNILMWSHYADNHKGICLEFDTSIRLFGTAREVDYRETYPLLSAQIQSQREPSLMPFSLSPTFGNTNRSFE